MSASPIDDAIEHMPDGRVLLMGMDPTLTLCPTCLECISEDYILVNLHAERGKLVHVRCMRDNDYFERHLLGDHHA